ncbi:MAG: hypothetical protein ACFCVA_02270 [Gammaproteobacteria bacterium]
MVVNVALFIAGIVLVLMSIGTLQRLLKTVRPFVEGSEENRRPGNARKARRAWVAGMTAAIGLLAGFVLLFIAMASLLAGFPGLFSS